MVSDAINEIIECFDRLIESLQDNCGDPSVIELVEDSKTAFLDMHSSDEFSDDIE